MNRLDYWINQISLHLKKHDPHCVIHTTKNTIENEDAHIQVKTSLKQQQILDITIPLTGEAILENYFIVVSSQPKKAMLTTI